MTAAAHDSTAESGESPATDSAEYGHRRWYATAGWVVAGVCILFGILTWCGFRSGFVRWIYRDGEAIWDSKDRLNIRSVLWSPPREIESVEKAAEGEDPRSRESAETDHTRPLATTSLVQSLKTEAGHYDLHVREWTPTGWTKPVLVGGKDSPIHSPGNEISPSLSTDRTTLFFASDRAQGMGGYDLYASRWNAGGWETPVHLGPHINSPYDDVSPTLHPSGVVLAFATNRPRSFILTPPAEWDDVPIANWQAADYEITYAIAPGDGRLRGDWSDPQALLDLNSSTDDKTPVFSPGGTFLYFASDRSDGLGGLDLFRARCRITGLDPNEITRLQVNSAENLGPPVNTKMDDSDPALFLEGFAMAYRVSDPVSKVGGHFETRSHEVAPEISFAAIPMEIVTDYVVQVGGMVLGGLGLAVVTWLLIRYRNVWSVSLLTRCLVAALLFHVTLFYFFYFWRVGSNIASLHTKTVLAEVSIERALQAKITVEAQRLRIELPDSEPTQREANRAPQMKRSALAVDPSAAGVETQFFDAPRFDAAPQDASPSLTVPSLPAAVSEPSATTDSSVEDLFAEDTQVESTSLPSPVPEEAPEVSVTPTDAARSLKVDAATPRPGPVGTMIEVAAAATSTTNTALAQAARTQVQAPVTPPEVLPPQAQSRDQRTEVAHELPVPSQSSQPEVEIVARPSRQAEMERPQFSAQRIRTDVPAEARASRWNAPPVGLPIPTTSTDAPLVSTPHLPVREPPPVPSADQKMPERTPMAEVASKSADEIYELTPKAADRRLPSQPSTAASRLLSSRDLVEMQPRIAPSETLQSVESASPAPLASTPQPGNLALPLSASRASPLPGPAPTLPDGEAGAKASEGAPEVADVLGPVAPKSRFAKAEFVPSARRRPTDSPEAKPVRAAHSTPGTSLSAPWIRRAGESARAASSDAPPFATEAEPVSVALNKLPEKSPERPAETDLREVRSNRSRKLLVEQMGGSRESENAVRQGLNWLAACQSADGRWDVNGFVNVAPESGSPGFHVQCDVALTGLAVMCFLGQNHTPANASSPYRRNVANALSWLVKSQAPDGLLAGEDEKYTMYGHGIASLALSEAYILTQDPKLKEPLERAARIILGAQNVRTGGWRYQPVPPLRGDTLISGWQIMALTRMRNASLQIPDVAFDRARHWLDEEVAGGHHRGIYGYSKPEEPRVAMVAEGMFARQLLGSRRTHRNVEEAARYIHTRTRESTHLDNLYLLYYGTLALYQYQGWIWERWNGQVRDYLVRTQLSSGPRAGSWDPTGPWSEAGGQVLATCFAILSLEVYYRYLPLFWQPADGIGK